MSDSYYFQGKTAFIHHHIHDAQQIATRVPPRPMVTYLLVIGKIFGMIYGLLLTQRIARASIIEMLLISMMDCNTKEYIIYVKFMLNQHHDCTSF